MQCGVTWVTPGGWGDWDTKAMVLAGHHGFLVGQRGLLIVDLADPSKPVAVSTNEFAVRDKATRELERFGELAEPALAAALEKPLDLETRRRAEQILARVRDKGAPTTPDWLRANRTVESLWRIGTAEAWQLLEAWAGDADGWHAAESRAVLALPKQVARKAE